MTLIISRILNMSIAAGILILAVVLIRLLFRRLPRKLFIIAWALVMIRLVCPFTVSNTLSPVPADFFNNNTAGYSQESQSEWSESNRDTAERPSDTIQPAPADTASGSAGVRMISTLWIAGMAVVLAMAGIKTIRLKKTVKDAACHKGNVYLSPKIRSSFTLGIIRPKIFISSDVSSEQREYIIDHEKDHIAHCDHLAKLLFYFLVAVHWFNPFCHIAYHLFSEDLEMACDERTVSGRGAAYRAGYSQTLLDCGIYSSVLGTGALSFGSIGIKRRVERIMNNKKTGAVSVVAFSVVCIALVFFLMTNNAEAAGKDNPSGNNDDYVHVVIRDANGGVVESTDIYQPDALQPPVPLPDLPEYEPVSDTDSQQFGELIEIRNMVLAEGVYRSSGKLGEPIYAVCSGEVISSERDGAYGLCVTVRDEEGRIWKYGHCSKLASEKGEHVSIGDQIAYVGTTGLIEKPGVIIRIMD